MLAFMTALAAVFMFMFMFMFFFLFTEIFILFFEFSYSSNNIDIATLLFSITTQYEYKGLFAVLWWNLDVYLLGFKNAWNQSADYKSLIELGASDQFENVGALSNVIPSKGDLLNPE